MELKKKKERDLELGKTERPSSDPYIFGTRNISSKEKGVLKNTNRGGREKGGKVWKAAGVVLEISENSKRMMEEEEQENPYLDAKVTDMLAYVSKVRTAEKARKKEAEHKENTVSESDTSKRRMEQMSDPPGKTGGNFSSEMQKKEMMDRKPEQTHSLQNTMDNRIFEKKEPAFGQFDPFLNDPYGQIEVFWRKVQQKRIAGKQSDTSSHRDCAESRDTKRSMEHESSEKAFEQGRQSERGTRVSNWGEVQTDDYSQRIEEKEPTDVGQKIFVSESEERRTTQFSSKGSPSVTTSKAAERYQEEKKKTEGKAIPSGKGRTGKDAGRKTADSIQGIQPQTKAAETARQTGNTAATKSSAKTSILTFAEAAWKAAQKIKREGFGKEKEEREMRGDERELAQYAQTAVKSNAQKTGNFLVFLLYGIPVAPILFMIIVLCLIVAGSGSVSSGTGLSAQYDKACYLAAKYESGGNPDQTGGDGGNACGEFQFDNRYELGPFVSWCYEQDPTFYAAFQPFLGMTTELKSNEDFYQAWHTICAANKEVFEAAQCEYVYTYTLMPLLQAMTDHYGFDFVNCSDALKGCILSFGNRDGKYVASIRRYFDGTTAASTDREIIERAYNAMIQRRPSIRRWRLEKQDCLALLDGSLDVYAPSENAAGSIDWSWKRIAGGSEVGNQVAQLAVSKVGCGYSQAHRDEEGWYDCSSLVYRCYAEAGITYLNGLTAAEEARYLVEHGMTVSREELQPGDIIFYSYEANGRYRNISHVAIYIGNNEMVHAANTSRGVVRDPLRESNLAEPLYCRPQ